MARVEAADIVPCSILGCEDAANIVIDSIWKSSRACKHSNMGSSSRARTYCNYNLAENCSASALSFPELADVCCESQQSEIFKGRIYDPRNPLLLSLTANMAMTSASYCKHEWLSQKCGGWRYAPPPRSANNMIHTALIYR